MKVKIVNDESVQANERAQEIQQKVKGISAIETVIVNPSSEAIVSEVCRRIEQDDIVVLDVSLGEGDLRWMGLEVFFKLFEGGNPQNLRMVFDSRDRCKSKLYSQWTARRFPLLFDELSKRNRIVFAYEDFNGDIVKAVRKALGFSFQDACHLLFEPFLCLHVAVQHIRENATPHSQTFAEMNGTDVYASLEWARLEAQSYLEDPLKPYTQRVGFEEHLPPLQNFLDGSLKRLCEVFSTKNDLKERLEEVQSLVMGGESASFLDEFQGASNALRAINRIKEKANDHPHTRI